MLTDRLKGLHSLHQILQLAAAQGVFWIWTILFSAFHDLKAPALSSTSFQHALVILMALIVHRTTVNVDKEHPLAWDWVKNHNHTSRQIGYVVAFYALYLIAFEQISHSRMFLIPFVATLYITLFSLNRFGLPFLAKVFFSDDRQDAILLAGTNEQNRKLKTWLDSSKSIGIRIAHEILLPADENDGSSSQAICRQIEAAVHEHQIKHLILTILLHNRESLRAVASLCNRLGVRLLMINSLHEQLGHSLTLFSLGGIQVLGLRTEQLESPMNRFLKRSLDIIISLPVVLCALPMLALVIRLAQVLQSHGPLLFYQQRIGLNNQQFQIVKFRTMHVGPFIESKQATNHDSRVYQFGKWFRRLSLDEFPQFWNVLKGDMSLVGPRPHLLIHNVEFARVLNDYSVRSFAKPGITGLAQVRGYRGEITSTELLEKRINADIYYIENWSITLDIVIIARTFIHLVKPPSTAY
jgi:exopolysaccharide biosynthesis polyprenyl glycosylphosphotransferase